MSTGIGLGIGLGVAIGSAFAWLQLQALRRNEMLERREQVPTMMRQIPGSMGRCAFLMMSLVGVQILFPSANLIWLSVGFIASYAIPFLWRLRVKYLQR